MELYKHQRKYMEKYEENWRKTGEKLEENRWKIGGKLVENWRKTGGNLYAKKAGITAHRKSFVKRSRICR